MFESAASLCLGTFSRPGVGRVSQQPPRQVQAGASPPADAAGQPRSHPGVRHRGRGQAADGRRGPRLARGHPRGHRCAARGPARQPQRRGAAPHLPLGCRRDVPQHHPDQPSPAHGHRGRVHLRRVRLQSPGNALPEVDEMVVAGQVLSSQPGRVPDDRGADGRGDVQARLGQLGPAVRTVHHLLLGAAAGPAGQAHHGARQVLLQQGLQGLREGGRGGAGRLHLPEGEPLLRGHRARLQGQTIRLQSAGKGRAEEVQGGQERG